MTSSQDPGVEGGLRPASGQREESTPIGSASPSSAAKTLFADYSGGRWHYPGSATGIEIIKHALRFALRDYERSNEAGRYPGHPYTQGPAAIRDALGHIAAWEHLATPEDDV